MKVFKDFCDRHGLLFYFCGGCCIGTLRHNGFIPWDDDIDVFMPRTDYEKLTELWQKEMADTKYRFCRNSENEFLRSLLSAVSIGQIQLGFSALAVKTTAAVIYVLRSLAAILYCKFKYPDYHFKDKPDTSAFSQRNAALVHQITGAVANNAATVLLTVLLKKDALAEVSVYSVYNLVAYSLSSFINAIINGLTPSFGQVIFKGEKDVLKNSFSTYEFLLFIIVFICYICMAVLLYPFISLYSADFNDGVVYLRPELVALFSFAGVLQAIRMPGLTLICAAGHYKETQGRAITELIINIAVSVALTPFFGIAGVILGMCASYLYRTTDVIIYSAKNFLPGTLKKTFVRLLRNLVVAVVLLMGGFYLVPQTVDSWLTWLISAVIFGIVSCVLLVLMNFVFEPDEYKKLLSRAKEMLHKG